MGMSMKANRTHIRQELEKAGCSEEAILAILEWCEFQKMERVKKS